MDFYRREKMLNTHFRQYFVTDIAGGFDSVSYSFSYIGPRYNVNFHDSLAVPPLPPAIQAAKAEKIVVSASIVNLVLRALLL